MRYPYTSPQCRSINFVFFLDAAIAMSSLTVVAFIGLQGIYESPLAIRSAANPADCGKPSLWHRRRVISQ